MPFPVIDINPLVALFIYDKHGNIIHKLENTSSDSESETIFRYFSHPITLIDWIIKYREITIFRNQFRATFFTLKNLIILFVSRISNSALEIRPIIKEYIKLLTQEVINELENKVKPEIIKHMLLDYAQKDEIIDSIFALLDHLSIELETKIERTLEPLEEKPEIKEYSAKTFEESEPFIEVPQIETLKMSETLLQNALKKAVTSLLFSTVKVCSSPAAAAYIYPREDGAIGQLYAGNLEEKKIIYVLETLARFPRVINEMLRTEEEIKVLNAEVVQIIVEDCHNGRILVGMTTSSDDVLNMAFRLKIIRHVIYNIGL